MRSNTKNARVVVVRELRARLLTPVPAPAGDAFVVAPDDLAVLGAHQAQIAFEPIEILAPDRDHMPHADRVVGVHQRVDARQLAALEHAGEQGLGRGRVAARLGAELGEDGTPGGDAGVVGGALETRLACRALGARQQLLARPRRWGRWSRPRRSRPPLRRRARRRRPPGKRVLRRSWMSSLTDPPSSHQELEPEMPEAVIVDAVRTPIGRAFKGSLAQLRPDEMGAFVLDALLERNPEVDPELIEEVYCGVGLPQGLQGFNIARIMVLLSEKLPDGRERRRCVALLRFEPRDDPPGGQRRRSRAGRRLHRRRRGVGVALQRGRRGGASPGPERAAAGPQRAARRLHLDGHDGGERGRSLRGQPRRHGQVRPALAGAGRAVPGERLLRPRDRADHPPRRHDDRQGRRPARQLDAREAVPAGPRHSGTAARSPPATRVRSTTARPPCS